MRNPALLSLAVTLALTGCVSSHQTNPQTADLWVDNQIAQSATAISLAQKRVQSTNAARQASNLTGVNASTPLPQTSPLRTLPAPGPSPSAPATTPTKSFPTTTAPPPTIINVVAAPAVTPKPPAPDKAAVIGTKKQPSYIHASQHAGTSPSVQNKPTFAPPLPKPEETWSLSPSDVTLRRVLAKWADRAGWQLVWDAPVDVPLAVNATLKGDFRKVVKKLFLSLSAADVNLTAFLYSGNRVLRVAESGRRAE
ncbi:toxin co-regulated pilus biosynthesis Q family protein [Pseudomonas fulva]|uniref:toxin co-regulated pilus biosynthesis Q family protein n=1 Tax=Pseudomonas fulva TaxID=47880 RepID=UPI002DBD6414|nr:toxin co-regulated pilus biosynthesis Q family protein [Pseudomonas fulva]MEB8059293.1 toxin co-regulated pilus biosynthesis Q family protein [Pseudomonas fulva]